MSAESSHCEGKKECKTNFTLIFTHKYSNSNFRIPVSFYVAGRTLGVDFVMHKQFSLEFLVLQTGIFIAVLCNN